MNGWWEQITFYLKRERSEREKNIRIVTGKEWRVKDESEKGDEKWDGERNQLKAKRGHTLENFKLTSFITNYLFLHRLFHYIISIGFFNIAYFLIENLCTILKQ